MNSPKKINEVKPREQVGSRTAEQYEYQYCQTAKACFGLLESSDSICVFCEWHDDFITEHSSPQIDIYAFSQVKTKSLAKGPWSFSEIFGVTKKPGLNQECSFFRMTQNHQNFRSSCRKFSFITNAGIKSEVSTFLTEISNAAQASALQGDAKKHFEKIWSEYQVHLSGYAESDFFTLLKSFKIEAEVGNLGEHANVLRNQIQDKVRDFCEIDLKGVHAKRITTNLLDLIRKKAQQQIHTIPVDEEKLRNQKAVVASDVLDLLPLSKEGLKALQSGNPDLRQNVIALSRLQRLCKRSHIPDNLIAEICNFKVSWDVWYLNKKHEFDEHDFGSLKWECVKALEEETNLAKLDEKAQDILNKSNPKLPSHLHLTKPLIMGLIFSLASQMENSDE